MNIFKAMNLFDVIAVIGLVQAAIVAVLIFTNKVFRNKANKYFAYFLVLVAVIGLDARLSAYYEGLPRFWAVFFDLVGDDIPWIMIFYLPLFKFFMEISDSIRPKIAYWLLFIPFFCFVIINGIIDLELEFNLLSAPFFTDNRITFYEFEDYIAIALFVGLHAFTFVRLIRTTSSKWLKTLWWYCSALILIWIVLVIDHAFFEDHFYQIIESMLWSGITVFIYWLMYSGLFQFNLANNRKEIREKLAARIQPEPPQPAADEPTRPKLSVKSKAHFEQLMVLMLVDKAYLNPELGRDLLAQQLGISPSYLTQLVKEHAQKNLATFMNEFRVDEACKMLHDPLFNTYDNLSIGLEAGFKSKSAYYTAFKTQTGMTPAQFKKNAPQVLQTQS